MNQSSDAILNRMQHARLKTREVIGMFRLFAELIAKHLDAGQKLAATESALVEERGEGTQVFIGDNPAVGRPRCFNMNRGDGTGVTWSGGPDHRHTEFNEMEMPDALVGSPRIKLPSPFPGWVGHRGAGPLASDIEEHSIGSAHVLDGRARCSGGREHCR